MILNPQSSLDTLLGIMEGLGVYYPLFLFCSSLRKGVQFGNKPQHHNDSVQEVMRNMLSQIRSINYILRDNIYCPRIETSEHYGIDQTACTNPQNGLCMNMLHQCTIFHVLIFL